MSPGRPYLFDLCCRRIGVRLRSSPSLALGAKDWSVPIIEVEDKIRAICRRYQVRELAWDVFRWARTFQVLDGEGLPVMEFPQTPARMTPASTPLL